MGDDEPQRKGNRPATKTAAHYRQRHQMGVEIEAARELREPRSAAAARGYGKVFVDVIESAVFQRLTKSEILVYVRLCAYADAKTGRAYPLRATLAECLRMDESTVSRAVGKLEGVRLIRRVEHENPRRIAYIVTAIEAAAGGGPRGPTGDGPAT